MEILELFTFWKILIVINAVLGVFLLEWSWKKFHRHRNPNKELNEMYPAFRRNDAEKWQKWKLYPGAMTVLLPRIIILTLSLSSITIISYILLRGHDTKKPLQGLRKLFVNF